MNIILLSGGSGKRLWPLSNDIRSKQFIKLFKDDNGEYKSMVQKVYQQITEVDTEAKVIIATSKDQTSSIYNQLGDKVSVCIEPCRKDTFPAIVLATAYLHDVLKINEDEPVIVCPVDPYVDNSFFECLKKVNDFVKTGNANITLMGIEPDYPSEKFGYIIPKTSDSVSDVKEFKEKPSKNIAEKYILQNALWNAGVFAFKIKYLLQKAENLLGFSGYEKIYKEYETLKKISFDYAVVEKEDSIQVVRYCGEWKDVGTWNALSEVLNDNCKGNVILDEKCENTHVINELNLPIIVMGGQNLVIAASNDGILVSDKERSDYLKPYAEKLEGEVKFAEKPWGTYSIIDTAVNSTTAKLSLIEGRQVSCHEYKNCIVIWTIMAGTGKLIWDKNELELKPGDVIKINSNSNHILMANTDMEIIENQIKVDVTIEDKTEYNVMTV